MLEEGKKMSKEGKNIRVQKLYSLNKSCKWTKRNVVQYMCQCKLQLNGNV